MIKLDAELRDKLIGQARKLADERGWTWREPVEVTSGLERGDPVWVICTNVLMRGTNVRVVLRKVDFSVVHAGFLPR